MMRVPTLLSAVVIIYFSLHLLMAGNFATTAMRVRPRDWVCRVFWRLFVKLMEMEVIILLQYTSSAQQGPSSS